MNDKILKIENLHVSFNTHLGEVQAIRGIGICLGYGEALGVVGESGSGKSVAMLTVMQLLAEYAEIKKGSICFKGINLLGKTDSEMQKIRGNDIAMIFQDPTTSLNPSFTIGNQIAESLLVHKKVQRSEAKPKVIELLKEVEISQPENRYKQYPYELSGGLQQRCMVAMALACDPDLLIADEPTTSLDVTTQAQIIALLKNIVSTKKKSLILISHDLGIISEVCDRIIVLYGGLIMEEGTKEDILDTPRHPYTKGLLKAVPSLDTKGSRLFTIPGTPPDMLNPPSGCPFWMRCQKAMNICANEVPPSVKISEHRNVRCWLYSPQYKETMKDI